MAYTSSTQLAETPNTVALLAASNLYALAPGSDVTQAFNTFRESIWKLIDLAPDASPYSQAWTMLDLHAKAYLRDYQAGNWDALDRLKQKIRACEMLLP
ncbi:hypothetical protein GCM10028805_45720 [Spirosoma harenae]